MRRGVQVVDREKWLQDRQSGIGSSEAAACLGIAPSPLEVYAKKIGVPTPDRDTIPKRVGRALEGTIAELYAEETGVEILESQIFVRCPTFPFMLATLDGVAGGGKVVEFKTISVRRSSELGLVEDERVPDTWLAQVHHQMIVAEVDEVDIAVLLGNEDFRVYTIHRDEMLCRLIVQAEEALWNSVLRREPPAPRDGDSYQTVLRAYERFDSAIQLPPDVEDLARIAHRYGQMIGHAEKARDIVRKEIAHRLGNAGAGVGPGGWTVTRKPVRRKAYAVQETTYTQMMIKAPKGYVDEPGIALPEIEPARSLPQGVCGDHGVSDAESGVDAPDVAPRQG